MRMLFMAVALLASISIALAAPAREKVKYPIPSEGFLKEMLADGWTLTSKPDTRASKTIISKESCGAKTDFTKLTKIRFSWVVLDKPMEVPPGSDKEFVYGETAPEATDISFTLDNGETLSNLHVAKSPKQILKGDEEAGIKISFKPAAPTKKDVWTRFVCLQEKIEIVQDDKTIEEGYLPHSAIVAFEKKVEEKEPPAKLKE